MGDSPLNILWHSGIVHPTSGVEWSFEPANKQFVSNRGYVVGEVPSAARYHRTIEHKVRMTDEQVKRVFEEARLAWDGTEYAVFKRRNCNHFVDDVLKRLGLGGHEWEYLEHGGFRQPIGTVQQLVQDAEREVRQGIQQAQQAAGAAVQSVGICSKCGGTGSYGTMEMRSGPFGIKTKVPVTKSCDRCGGSGRAR
jgi:hypothetical protein